MKIIDKINFYRSINFISYIYLNYFSKNIIRNGKGKIIPYKNSIIVLESNSKIIINDNDLLIGTNKLRKSRAETLIRLRNNAQWFVNKGAQISYGTTIEILKNAIIDSNYFTMNSFGTIVCAKKITIGNDVMIGRNVIVYDSDFHEIVDGANRTISKEVVIGNHVWLATNVTVLKGVTIGDESVIASNTIVSKDVQAKQLIISDNKQLVVKENISWRR